MARVVPLCHLQIAFFDRVDRAAVSQAGSLEAVQADGPSSRAAMESGWAALPSTLVQAILCRDMETFYKGAQVCKAWNNVTKGKGVGPKAMKIDLTRGESGDSWAICWQKLTKYAPKDLCSLQVFTHWRSVSKRIGNEYFVTMGSPEVFQFCFLLSSFAKLTELDLYHAELQDWSVFNCFPEGLVKLSFSTLSSKSKPRSLRCFDKFNVLRELNLQFRPPDDCVQLVVTDDLSLSNLQHFRVGLGVDLSIHELVEGEVEIVFTDLTLTGVPASCDSVFPVECWAESQHEALDVGDCFFLSNVDSSRLWLDICVDFGYDM
ncbi:hypothetical protein ABBQ38_010222 [Trebouxia sp. C0009 RCD-2024]